MSKKYFIYRNSTLEHIFKNVDCKFSSYGGVEKCEDADRTIIVLYLMPFNYSEKVLADFIKEFSEKTAYIARMYPDRTVQVFSLYNYFYRSFDVSNDRIEKMIAITNARLRKVANVHIVNTSKFFLRFNQCAVFDEKFYYLYNTIISPKVAPDFLEWFNETQSRLTESRKKCLVLDLDNTLWGGILGEDGVAGVKISGSYPGNAYHDFQALIKEVADTGIILCTCSKNNESDVKECFKKRDDMVLKYDDFVLHYINWDDKAKNLANIAKRLNIGLDAIVFIDDNPRERELIKMTLPDVIVPDFPDEPYKLVSHFAKVFMKYFGSESITAEDRDKKTQYKHMLESDEFKQSFTNEEDFIKELHIELSVLDMDDTNIVRFAQLINKSNQFNLTTKRYTEDDLRQMQKDGYLIKGIKVRDKFGDLGISGICIARPDGDEAEIDTFLMSCRVLGRKIEDEFLKAVLNELRNKGAKRVRGEYIATKKNALVKDYYAKFGFAKESENHYIYDLAKEIKMDKKYKMKEKA
jgi:FkbH-like protein